MSDVFRMLFVDLREVRQVSEMGVDFGSANERLPKVCSFSACAKHHFDGENLKCLRYT